MPTRGAERSAEERRGGGGKKGGRVKGFHVDGGAAPHLSTTSVFYFKCKMCGVTALRLTELPTLHYVPAFMSATRSAAFSLPSNNKGRCRSTHPHAARLQTILFFPLQGFFVLKGARWNLFKQLKVTTSTRTHVMKSFSHR